MSRTRRYQAIKHPSIEGAWTVTPYQNGVRLMIVSKARAEIIAHHRNEAMRVKERSRIWGW